MRNHMYIYFIAILARPAGIIKSPFLYIICNGVPPLNTSTDLIESVSSQDPG